MVRDILAVQVNYAEAEEKIVAAWEKAFATFEILDTIIAYGPSKPSLKTVLIYHYAYL